MWSNTIASNAEFSRDELIALRQRLGLDYDQRSQGTLQLFRTQKQFDASAEDIAVLENYGVAYTLLGRDGCVGAEPGLAAAQDRFVGGLRLPGDETGDCHLFTRQLAGHLPEMGVELRYNSHIAGLEMHGGRVAGVRTDAGLVRGDAYLVALGSYSPALLRPAGVCWSCSGSTSRSGRISFAIGGKSCTMTGHVQHRGSRSRMMIPPATSFASPV